MSTQVDLFTNVEPTSVSPAIAKPFVSRSTFYQGDCLVEMDKIEDKSVNLILTDLPYGITGCKWDTVISLKDLWQQYERIITNDGAIILTASQPFTSNLLMSNPKLFKYELIWEKSRASNFVHANYQPLKAHENILVFSKSGAAQGTKNPMVYNKQITKGKPYNKGFGHKDNLHLSGGLKEKDSIELVNETGDRTPRSVIYFSCDADKDRGLHPTQKPTPLFEYLIKTYSHENDVVLDSCMGSGTTGVAAMKTGRHFIGIEKDEKYFEIAVSRVSAYCG